MNKLETLKIQINANGKSYSPHVFITAWRRWCVAYRNIFDHKDHLCSVCIEPENVPTRIEDTIDGYCLNRGIGNARNIDDAIDMIKEYVKQYEDV